MSQQPAQKPLQNPVWDHDQSSGSNLETGRNDYLYLLNLPVPADRRKRRLLVLTDAPTLPLISLIPQAARLHRPAAQQWWCCQVQNGGRGICA
jgi:hypothetical protein